MYKTEWGEKVQILYSEILVGADLILGCAGFNQSQEVWLSHSEELHQILFKVWGSEYQGLA